MKLQFTRVLLALFMLVSLTATALAQADNSAPKDVTVTCKFGAHSSSSKPKNGNITFKGANVPGATGGDVVPPPSAPGASYTWQLVEREGRKDYLVSDEYGYPVARFAGIGDANTSSSTIMDHVITGTYRGDPVTHYLNPSTGLNVIADRSGNFVSGWKLSAGQLGNVLSHGGL